MNDESNETRNGQTNAAEDRARVLAAESRRRDLGERVSAIRKLRDAIPKREVEPWKYTIDSSSGS